MRFLISALVISGCFDPQFQQGVPCSVDGKCPGSQVCAFDDRCYDPENVPEPNDDSTLSNLELSAGELEPAFDSAITEYTVTLGLGPETISITPTATAGAGTAIILNEVSIDSGATSDPISLDLGENPIEIRVLAEDDSTTTYRLGVNRGADLLQRAYVKASNTDAGDDLGISVAISGDTIVVGARDEDSNANGINGLESNNTSTNAGAVYVFVRDGESWSQQAYIKASRSGSGDLFGSAVAISGDTLAVGAPREDSNSVGVDGDEVDDSAEDAGAVYVFVRTGTFWSQQAYIKASNTGAGDLFGTSVALADETLAVGAIGEASSATGIDGNELDNSAASAGAVYVFRRTGGLWTQDAYIKASNTDADDRFGQSVAITGDTLAVGAIGEDSGSTGVNGNPSDNSASSAGAAYVFTRVNGSWSPSAYLKASNTDAGDSFGTSLSFDGDSLVIGATGEDSSAMGVNGDETNDDATSAGAVYVFVGAANNWLQQAYLKASNTEGGDLFGRSVAIAGDILAIGAVGEASSATGVGGDQSDNAAPESGAVYLFARRDNVWTQHKYIKASNSFINRDFATSVAVSGAAIAVGAIGDDSSATGINGDDTDSSANDSGAIYVFE